MYYTHHFAHEKTLERVCQWLATLGVSADRIQAHREGVLRLTVSAPVSQFEWISLLVSAAERSDPDGWPSFWEEARRGLSGQIVAPVPVAVAAKAATADAPHRSVVGWHPPMADAPHPDAIAIRDALSVWP